MVPGEIKYHYTVAHFGFLDCCLLGNPVPLCSSPDPSFRDAFCHLINQTQCRPLTARTPTSPLWAPGCCFSTGRGQVRTPSPPPPQHPPQCTTYQESAGSFLSLSPDFGSPWRKILNKIHFVPNRGSFHEVVPQPGLSEAISILQRLREQDGTRADDGQFVVVPS